MIVCTVPRETNASPPAARTFSATASMSASVASAFITTTMSLPVPLGMSRDHGPPRDEKTPGPARGRCPLVYGRRLRRAAPVIGKPAVEEVLHVAVILPPRYAGNRPPEQAFEHSAVGPRLGCGDAAHRRGPSARRRPADEAPRQADRAGRVPIPHATIGRDPGRGGHARRSPWRPRSGDAARAVHRFGARRRPGGHPRPARRPRLAGRRHRPLPGHDGRLPRDGARRGDARAAGLLREAPAARRAARAVARPDARHGWVRLRRGHVRASRRSRSASRSSAWWRRRRGSRAWRPTTPACRSSPARWTAS